MSEIIKEGNQIIVKPGQDIVASSANEFRNELQVQIQKSPVEIIIDLKDVDMVDSFGIGVLIEAHNSLNNAGSKLIVTNIKEDIYTLFTTMRLDRHFTVEKA